MKIKPCQLNNQAKLEEFITWSNSNSEYLWNNLYALHSSSQNLWLKHPIGKKIVLSSCQPLRNPGYA